MGDPSSLDHAGSESEFDSGRELDSEREPDSGRELDSDRESYTGTSGPSESPFETSTPYQKARAGSSRTPFRTLQQSGPSRLPGVEGRVNLFLSCRVSQAVNTILILVRRRG